MLINILEAPILAFILAFIIRYKNEVGDWTEWETCADTKTWTLTSGDGEKTVYYHIQDI